jgi:hypothetical protein
MCFACATAPRCGAVGVAFFSFDSRCQATFEVFVSSRASGQPEAMGATFPDPERMDLASAGAWPLTDFFGLNVSSPEQAALFAKVLGVQYLPRGTAGGGSRDAANSALVANKTAYAAAAAGSPWGVEQLAFLFSLQSFEQLQRIVWDDYPPCAGDVTPFVLLPPPVFLPSSYYANYLTLAPRQGISWSANQLESQSTFAQQPALTFASYNGQVTAWQPRLALSLLRALRDGPPQACPAFEVSFPQPREYAVAGWYPNSLRVSYDGARGRFTVAMGQLQYRVDYASKLASVSKASFCFWSRLFFLYDETRTTTLKFALLIHVFNESIYSLTNPVFRLVALLRVPCTDIVVCSFRAKWTA